MGLLYNGSRFEQANIKTQIIFSTKNFINEVNISKYDDNIDLYNLYFIPGVT